MTTTENWNAEQMDWYNSRPQVIQKAIDQFDPTRCYRLKQTNGHYHLRSFLEPEKESDPVGVTIAHLPDSYLPGFSVFGLTTDDLVLCGCRDN